MVDIINYDSLVPPLYYHTWLTPNGEIYLCYPANNLLHSWPRPPLSPATPGHRQCMLYIIMPRHHYFSEPTCIFLCAQQSLHEFLIELQRNNWRCMSQSQRKHLLLLSHLRHYQLLSRRNYHIKGPTRPSIKIMVSASQFHVSTYRGVNGQRQRPFSIVSF